VPGLTSVAPLPSQASQVSSENTPGRAVAAVEAEIAALGAHGRRGLAAAAIAMAAILDDPRHVPTQPAAARQLAAILDTLHRHRVRPGRLAAVQAMTSASRD